VSKCWPEVRLSEIIRQEREQVGTPDGNGLPVLGVTNIKGVTHTGVEASDDRSKYLRLRPGRFAYNPYRVNVGSIGLSAETQDGICSPSYVVFTPTERVRARFLWFFLKSARGSQLINFHGNRGTVRGALRFEDLCEIKIPLPPLAEQQRIVARIDELTGRIAAARGLRAQAEEEAKAIMSSARTQLYDYALARYSTRRLGDVCRQITDGTHSTPQYVENGVPFLSVKDITSGRIRFDECRHISPEEHEELTRRCRPEAGDVLLTKIGTTGFAKVIDVDREFSIFVSLALLKVDKKLVDCRFIEQMLNSGRLREHSATGTRGVGNQNLVLKFIREFPVPVPPLHEQRKIVSELEGLQAEVDAAKRLQAETAAELHALLPSILDRAFKGKL